MSVDLSAVGGELTIVDASDARPLSGEFRQTGQGFAAGLGADILGSCARVRRLEMTELMAW